ncbi:hypothetical protein V1505DRAFT_417338 [Lipomyces doorenjongii]
MSAGQLQNLVSQPELVSHLELFYSVTVKVHCLDTDIYRLDHTLSKSGTEISSWVIRVFPPSRPWPETPVAPTAVSSYEGHGILVTHFIAGEQPPPGAWHHLCSSGDVSEEVRAADAAISATAAKQDLTAEEHCELELLYGLGKLSKTLVHPDIVPSNAILTADGQLRIIDWAGAGEGPRAVALGFLLWAAGARKQGLSAIAKAGYCMHATLEPEEIERLADAVYLRPLTMSCWSFSKGRKSLHELVQELRPMRELAESIASKAAPAFIEMKGNP